MLVTKQYLYETISALLEGGDPSAGKKFERRLVEAYMQQAINRKLKTEYITVTLPGDETIPEGLVLACYNDIPVTSYKNNLSRAILPAMPVSLRKNMGVYFVGPATGGNLPPNGATTNPVITIEAQIGTSVAIAGTEAIASGLTAGSSNITCVSLANRNVNVIRGYINIAGPNIVPTDGSTYYTKVLASSIVSLSQPLVTGEYIKIQTV